MCAYPLRFEHKLPHLLLQCAGMLWLAVKSYCVEMLVQEELAAQRKGGSILQSPEDLERLQARADQCFCARHACHRLQGEPGHPARALQGFPQPCCPALQAAKRLYEAAKNSKELREAVNTPLRGAAARLASLMQCMKVGCNFSVV